MPDIQLTCSVSGQPFTITESDQAFYKKINVPLPTLCPKERLRRRATFRNELHLYKRTCDMCSATVFSVFDTDVEFPVYCVKCWWSDAWDPQSYAKDFDFTRPFFDQYHELLMTVPKAAALQLGNENCDYNALVAFSKNAYMSPGSYLVEDCYYTRKSQSCKDCVNSNALDRCELVAYSTNCNNCYSSHHLVNCRNCLDSSFLSDCSNCQNCFMCSGLRNKKFCFKNQQYSQEDYKTILKNYATQPTKNTIEEFKNFINSLPQRSSIQMNSENCTGDYIYNSQNAFECFDCFDLQDCKYMFECADVKDSMDILCHDKEIELCYEICSGGEKNYNTKFAYCAVASSNSEYTYACFYLLDSFGCDGFHFRNKNCILNKKYSEEEYANLKAKIIDHMKGTGEYGEFFPIKISPFKYNESGAQTLLPLTREQCLEKGYLWKEIQAKEYASPTASVPENIASTPDSIMGELLACTKCRKNYKIIPQELKIYRKLNVPAPKHCTECRLKELDSFKNPRQLIDSNCSNCQVQIQTTHPEESGAVVYCEKCYLNWVN